MGSADWNDARRKAWHALLMFAAAYATTRPQFGWTVPVLTGMAGVSTPPSLAGRGTVVGAVLLAVALGAAVTRWTP